MTKVKGKVIWITGASSGIGEALVYELVNKKARLIISARRQKELERIKGTCPAEAQPDIKLLPLDLESSSTLSLTTEAAVQLFGHIDILINNAGVSQRSFVKDTLPEVDRRIMEINYFGTICLTKALLPHFLARKGGHIVNVSSITGRFGTPYRSAYAASKHALHGFFDSMRAELWKERILITMICPGFINTPITLHAITGNGSPLNQRDEANYKGKPAKWCARKIIRAIERNKEEVNIGGYEVLGVYLKRFFPKLFSRVIRNVKVR